jgi:hypothetical protein
MCCKNYEELESHRKKFTYSGGEENYWKCLDTGDFLGIIDHLYNETKEDIIMEMMPKNGSIEGYAQYLVEKYKF